MDSFELRQKPYSSVTLQTAKEDLVLMFVVKLPEHTGVVLYPYKFMSAEEILPTMPEQYSASYYVWATTAMLAIGRNNFSQDNIVSTETPRRVETSQLRNNKRSRPLSLRVTDTRGTRKKQVSGTSGTQPGHRVVNQERRIDDVWTTTRHEDVEDTRAIAPTDNDNSTSDQPKQRMQDVDT